MIMMASRSNSKGEVKLSEEMVWWWTSLAAASDPNTNRSFGAPTWTAYNPLHAPEAMVMGSHVTHSATPVMNSSVDTVRKECEHWKQYMGWIRANATAATPT